MMPRSKSEQLEKLDETGEKLIKDILMKKVLLWVNWFQSLGDISENKHRIISLRDLNDIKLPLSPNIGLYLSRLLPHWGGSSTPRDKAPQVEKTNKELTVATGELRYDEGMWRGSGCGTFIASATTSTEDIHKNKLLLL